MLSNFYQNYQNMVDIDLLPSNLAGRKKQQKLRIVENVFSGILLIVTEQYVSDGFLLHKDTTTSLCALWCLQGLLLKDDT